MRDGVRLRVWLRVWRGMLRQKRSAREASIGSIKPIGC